MKSPKEETEDVLASSPATATAPKILVDHPQPNHHRSVKSQMSEISTASLISCETPKQRITEILRKDLWHHDDLKIVSNATEELTKFVVNGSDKQRSYVVQCGGVMALLRLIEEYTNHESIQYDVCIALRHLAMDCETQMAISEMDGIPLVVKSMQYHPNSTRLQEAARAALTSICCNRRG